MSQSTEISKEELETRIKNLEESHDLHSSFFAELFFLKHSEEGKEHKEAISEVLGILIRLCQAETVKLAQMKKELERQERAHPR